MEQEKFSYLDTKIGKVYFGIFLGANLKPENLKLSYLSFKEPSSELESPNNEIFDFIKLALKDYFIGSFSKLSKIPLNLEGSDFQKLVWEETKCIPAGKTLSYKELAERISRPKAARAVGSALSKNSILLAIPCHRVISSSNKLTGFNAGLERKKYLLELEAKG